MALGLIKGLVQVASNCLVIFAKTPEIGKVKTRLGKDIGFDKARDIYERILLRLIDKHERKEYATVFYVSGNAHYFLDKNLDVATQIAGSLGDKLFDAFCKQLGLYEKVVIIGSDTPSVSSDDIRKAFFTLDAHDVVLGPAVDGGYYLVGLKDVHNIFHLSAWSHKNVLRDTLKIVQEKGLSYALLDEKRDIDTLEDLQWYESQGYVFR